MRVVTRDPLSPDALLEAVGDVGRGGAVLFLGSVRRSADDGDVAAIEYSAYEAMVEDEWVRLQGEVRARWPDVVCALRHRVGTVAAGEPSIAVAAAAPHRAEAFEACRYVIDEAKRRLPVWKKEQFGDGAEHWREDVPDRPAGAGREEG